jgi:hypothetical protein
MNHILFSFCREIAKKLIGRLTSKLASKSAQKANQKLMNEHEISEISMSHCAW